MQTTATCKAPWTHKLEHKFAAKQLDSRINCMQKKNIWNTQIYHLEITAAWSAIHNVGPGPDIKNYRSVKPGDHQVCALRIHLPWFIFFHPEWPYVK
jgi:hypothetical protein